MDTTNSQLVGVNGEGILIMAPRFRMTFEEALRHAAWIVALAERTEGQFAEILEAVRQT